MIVNQAKIAEILGISQRTLLTLQGKGMPYQARVRNGGANRYDTTEVIHWMIDRARSDSLNAEKTRLTREQADKTAIENARRRTELIPAGDVERAWGSMVEIFKERLNRLPASMAKQLSAEMDHAGILSVLRAGVRECLTELAQTELSEEAPNEDPA